jgi:hypothetical protein
MRYTATLETICSKPSRAGYVQWAFRFIDHETGKVVEAKSGGGESNINAIRRDWKGVEGWDHTFLCSNTELAIRDFERLTKAWPYAGSQPGEMQKFILAALAM